jgi:UDP-glucose 4-epimerase
MKILITGGAGYVGSACLRHVARHGHEVVAYDNLVEGHSKAVDGHPLVVGDIADTEKLTQVLGDEKVDAVMHFAAATNVGESVENPEYHYRNNIGGTLSLLNAMRGAGVKRMLFSSTSSLYGLSEKVPMDEETPQNPINPYARSKMAVEWMIRDFSQAYGLGFTLLRYFNAAGADPSGEFGEFHDPETHLIPRVLEVALGKRDKVMIFGTDYATSDGTCLRDYVHIEDLGAAHRLAIEATTPGTAELYNVGIGRGYTVREVVEACARVTGRPIPTEDAPRRAGDPTALLSDPTKLMTQLGWQPSYTSIEDIVATAWAWHRAYPEGYQGPRWRNAP